MITYNHEKFIAEAIEGILMQQTTFPVEIVVGDDASVDGTQAIIEYYKLRHSDKIKYLRNSTNVGMHQNFINTLRNCKGKYIAFCEGDDFWHDSNKLQKQVEFLEENDEAVLCSHGYKILDHDKGKITNEILLSNEIFEISISELVVENMIPSHSIIFRNIEIKTFPEWFYDCEGGDWPLYIMLSEFGRLYYLPFIASTYREHIGGVSYAHKKSLLALSVVLQKRMNTFRSFDNFFDFKYHSQLSKQIVNTEKKVFDILFKLKKNRELLKFVKDNNIRIVIKEDKLRSIKYLIASISMFFRIAE